MQAMPSSCFPNCLSWSCQRQPPNREEAPTAIEQVPIGAERIVRALQSFFRTKVNNPPQLKRFHAQIARPFFKDIVVSSEVRSAQRDLHLLESTVMDQLE